MKRSKRRWSPKRAGLPPLQAIGRAVYSAAFNGEPLPKGWRFEWAGFMRGALGLTVWGQRLVLLSAADVRRKHGHADALRTLVHECVHVHCGPGLRHGKEFDRIEEAAWRRVFASTESDEEGQEVERV